MSCQAKQSMRLIHNRSVFNDKQIIRLQEAPEHIPRARRHRRSAARQIHPFSPYFRPPSVPSRSIPSLSTHLIHMPDRPH